MRSIRSFLFVPADNERLLAKAAQRSADMLILDLEDGVAPSRKVQARSMLASTVRALKSQGADVCLRINANDWVDDLEAAPLADIAGIVVPKVERPEQLASVAAWLDGAADASHVQLVALIETPAAIFNLPAITAAPRVAGLALGSEDFALCMGVAPSISLLTLPCALVAIAAASAGIAAIGVPASLAGYQPDHDFMRTLATALAIGSTGALCIHPAQISAVNETFTPSADDQAWAGDVVAAWEQASADGVGAISVGGKMIDLPVVQRARAILAYRENNT